jgi:hypothetical protein
MTPSVLLVEVLMDSMISLWSDLSRIPPNVCQTELSITMHSAPWSRMQERICPWCVTALIHLSNMKCSVTMQPLSLLCRHLSYFFKSLASWVCQIVHWQRLSQQWCTWWLLDLWIPCACQ